MKKLLAKEMKLTASLITYFFIGFSVMTMIPGYPILMGAFFVCFGIFQTFQSARESNDILYSVLLPAKKSDVVKAKFLFTLFIQGAGFVLMAVLTLVRMTVLSDASAYIGNPMMNANFVYLGYVLLIFASFNLLFVGGFFKTAYYYGKPFIKFIIAMTVIVGVGETLHHLPKLGFLNSASVEKLPVQLAVLAVSAVIFALVTVVSYKSSKKSFELIDL